VTAGQALSEQDPTLGEVAGRSVVLRYGNVSAEYAALRSGAMLVDRTARGRLRVLGPKGPELITGLVTNDIMALPPGHGAYAAALTPKGKIVADIRIFAREGELLIDTPPRAQDGWLAMVKKFVNPRLAMYVDESTTMRTAGAFGSAARRITSVALGVSPEALSALPIYGHMTVELDGTPVLVARVPELELEGYEMFVAHESFASLWHRLLAAGGVPGGLDAWEIARIEAGRPEWGLDIDDTTIPQEANFDELHAISYTKGCYVGQEVVARVHFRGHVNRHLRGLLCGDGPDVPFGAQLLEDGGKDVGTVRSSALSPRLGAVALAMVRREVEVGSTLTVRWEGGEAKADLAALPFPL
jgi:folate-binding protein YgfZ